MSLGDPLLEARLARALLAGARAVALLTDEDDRALLVAEAIAERLRWPLHTWSVASGIDQGGRERDLGALLAHLREQDEDELWLLFEAGRELRSSAQRRMLRELAQARRGPALILVESDSASVPDLPELERELLALPDRELLRERVLRMARELHPERPTLAEAMSMHGAAEAIATAGLGLALSRFERTLVEATQADACTPASISAALTRRRLIHACGTLLEPVDPRPPDALIGFERYLEWVRERSATFDPATRLAGLRRARGVGLIGAPGSGLELAVRVGAGLLGLPLLRIHPSVSADAAGLRSIITALERAAPVALWLEDRTEPQLVDQLARWHALRAAGVFLFVVLTHPRRLPPPWRSGDGLDALFFVDLPGPKRRAELLAALLARETEAGAPPPIADRSSSWLDLARAASGCSAADLAEALTRARLRGFARGRPPSAADFEAALAELSPLESRYAQALDRLRRWARPLARDADC
ncbi:MAG: hypothetical protein R6X02_08805 [Enhygromyxa sp.]